MMKHLYISVACLAIAGCNAPVHKPSVVSGVSVSFNQPQVTVVKDRLYVNGFDEGPIKAGDKVVVTYCGVTVNGESRAASTSATDGSSP